MIMRRVALYFALPLGLLTLVALTVESFWFHFSAWTKISLLVWLAVTLFTVRLLRHPPAPAAITGARSNVRVAVFWGTMLLAVAAVVYVAKMAG